MKGTLLKMTKMDKFIGLLIISIFITSCESSQKDAVNEVQAETPAEYPSDVIPSLDQWTILLGNGDRASTLRKFKQGDHFYNVNDGTDWVVYKAPNAGVTSRTSSNTRSELGQKKKWTAAEGGKLTGTLKVMHVSTSGDARVAASYSVVVGQIHSGDGHENEPLKIFYKKFPGHKKGSVFWNYEINPEGDNAGRWDFSTAVWGYDMSEVGDASDSYPDEPAEGIELGEEFRYEVNVYEGIMYLRFESEGHETRTFTKDLLNSEFTEESKIPAQIVKLYSDLPERRIGVERAGGYEEELQYFKQGAYNQTNGKKPETNMVWSTGSETYDGDILKQYDNGCYTEVWFRESSLGPGTPPKD